MVVVFCRESIDLGCKQPFFQPLNQGFVFSQKKHVSSFVFLANPSSSVLWTVQIERMGPLRTVFKKTCVNYVPRLPLWRPVENSRLLENRHRECLQKDQRLDFIPHFYWCVLYKWVIFKCIPRHSFILLLGICNACMWEWGFQLQGMYSDNLMK